MTFTGADTLLGSAADMARLHRRVVRVGAVASWMVAALFLIAGFFTVDNSYFVESLGPILAGSFLTALIVVRRENGGVALLGTALVVVVKQVIAPDPQMILAAGMSLVVLASLGMLLVTRHLRLVMGIVAVVIATTPFVWGVPEDFGLSVAMTASFVLTTVILITLRNAATVLNNRFQVMFERSPTALFEEDWSESLRYLHSEYSGHPNGLAAFLTARPSVVRSAVGKARITRVNQAGVDLLEASGPDDLLGPRNPARVTGESIDVFNAALVALYSGAPSFEHEFRGFTLRGRPVCLQVRVVNHVPGRQPKTLLMALADITHVKEREEAMADLVKNKDAFVAAISHELRTPLTAVVGLTSEMMSPAMRDEERLELIGLVNSQAEEMSSIIDDLLVAARAGMGTLSLDIGVVDLEEQLEAARRGVGVSLIESPTGLPPVTADAGRVRQVLRNLLTNQIRYGGIHRRVLGGTEGPFTWLEVRDDGEGVPAVDVERIFEPYATGKAPVAGSVGLGLSVARQLCEMMGGRLSYFRGEGESVFRLELPTAEALIGSTTS